ncbi:hypothetical protein ABZ892_26825 [Streptomyces sp. NPDC046924]|uniref:hypothetical protein n=1 Tax=Streptomyces sp. NPDC046924 TaxID=3155136 RepID=UPI0033F743D3
MLDSPASTPHGNWLGPLGVCSLVIQGIVVVMAGVALSGPAPLRPGHLVRRRSR